MKREEKNASDTQLLWKQNCKTLTLTGESVLELSLSWPEPEGKKLKGVRKYYQALQQRFQRKWESELYLRACMALVEKRDQSRVFTPWQASLSGEVTNQNEKYFSITMTARERHGDHRLLEYRWGDVWYQEDGCPMQVKECFSDQKRWRKTFLTAIAAAGADLQEHGVCLDKDGIKRLHKCISPHNFALTEQEIIFYCPQCTVAPAVEGTLEFRIPKSNA